MKGTVKFFDARKGYGFITSDDGGEYFVHYSNIQMDGYRKLRKGQAVTFEAGSDAQGRKVAISVVPAA